MAESSTALGDRLFLAIYFGSHKIPGAICYLLRAADAGIRSVVIGLWLGILTPRLLSKLDEWYYTRGFAGTYGDERYNRSGLYDWEREAIEQYFPKSSRVLIAVGAGAGREMLALNRIGIPVDGFEYNPALVKLGNTLLREDGWEPTLREGPADGVPAGERRYEAAIVGWGTYTLIAGKAARTELLRQVRARCLPGSPVLLSFFCRTGNSPSCRLTAGVANCIRVLLGRQKVEMGDTLSVSFAHRFTEGEVEQELREGGFEPLLYRSEPYGHAVGIALPLRDQA